MMFADTQNAISADVEHLGVQLNKKKGLLSLLVFFPFDTFYVVLVILSPVVVVVFFFTDSSSVSFPVLLFLSSA